MQVEHDTLTAEKQNEDREGNDNEPAERPRVHFVSQTRTYLGAVAPGAGAA